MPPTEFIDFETACAIHDDQIERFGGSLGIRDEGLLLSALAQPVASFFGELLHPTIFSQAAAYLYHISRNHPFIDGNKRTAFGVMEAFIRTNGYRLNLSYLEKFDLVLKVATGELEKNDATEIIQRHLVEMKDN